MCSNRQEYDFRAVRKWDKPSNLLLWYGNDRPLLHYDRLVIPIHLIGPTNTVLDPLNHWAAVWIELTAAMTTVTWLDSALVWQLPIPQWCSGAV